MLVRARTVVTMDGPPIDNGAVEISGDRIVNVGTFGELGKESTGDVVDLGERVLLPGLINSHCHLDYTGLRGRITSTNSFTDWIRAINAEKEELSAADYVASIDAGISEAESFGTTSIVNLEAFPELVPQISSEIRIWWLGELIDVRVPQSSSKLLDGTVQLLNTSPHWGLAPHSPFTASAGLFRKCEKVGRRELIPLSTHLAESREEMMMFRDGAGPLHDFIGGIGRDMSDCGKQTPLGHFLAMLNTDDPGNGLAKWLIAHLNELSAGDFELLERLPAKFHIVHCPRSHRYFGHTPFDFDRLNQLGFNICLGTDSLASNSNLNLFDEMRAFRREHGAIGCREIFEMVTINPARALRQDRSLGRIRQGFYADLIAITHSNAGDVFEAIIDHEGPVSWVMASGRQLHR